MRRLAGTEEVKLLVKKIAQYMDRVDFHSIWTRFSCYPFAIYNEQIVALHTDGTLPNGFHEEDGACLGNWNDRFAGNTAIEYDGQMIAIWDQRTIRPNDTLSALTASIVHEMFHCYQWNNQLFRNVNELQLLQYPFTPENIAYRLEERQVLLRAVFADQPQEQQKLISTFIQLRETRRALIQDYLNYELAIESNEGTAAYVEIHAHRQVSNLPIAYLLAIHGRDLMDIPENLRSFRASCYASGMYIALLLDKIAPNWKEEFEASDLSLYELLRKYASYQPENLPSIDTSVAAKIILQDEAERKRVFQQFSEQQGYRICIYGEMQLIGFDPINILSLNHQTFHKSFVKIKVKDQEYFIVGPVVSENEDSLWKMKKIEFISSTRPTITAESLTIEGVGNFAGKVEQREHHYVIYLG